MNLSFLDVEVQNFKSFQGTHRFEFPHKPGLYFVTGSNQVEEDLASNGAGKSTLFTDSIYWCLTGKTIRANRPGDAVESWNGSGKTSVTLHIEIDGKQHSICRTRRPNSFSIDGENEHQSNVFKLLQLSEESLRHTILIGQFGELFLDLRPEQQAAMFTELLNLNVWLEASDKANVVSRQSTDQLVIIGRDRNRFEGQLVELERQIVGTKESLDSFEVQKKERMTSISKAYKAAVDKLEQFDSETISKDMTIINIDIPIKELQVLEAEVDELNIQSNKLTRSLTKSRFALDQDRNKLATYESSNTCPECGQVVDKEHIESRIIALKSNIENWERLVNLDLAELNVVEGSIATKREVIAGKRVDLESKRKEQLEIVRRQTEISRHRSLLESEVTVQKRLLEEEKSRVNVFVERLQDLDLRLKNTADQVEALAVQCSDLEKKVVHHNYWMQAFKEIRLDLIDSVLQELGLVINNHAQAHGLSGWNIEFRTERTTQSGTVSHKFNVLLYPPNQSDPIPWESYSGGEVQRWQLAATEGLAEVLLGRSGIIPDLEIFDEPTAHLSEQGIEDLLLHLRDRAIHLGRRIILIDHRTMDQGEFDGIIRIVKDSSGSHVEQ